MNYFRSFIELYILTKKKITKNKTKQTTKMTNPEKNKHNQKKKKKTIPASMGLCLELAYPVTGGSGPGSDDESRDASGDSAPFRHRLPLNAFIDSILRTVYHHASAPAPPTTTSPDGHGVRRQIIFTSSSPDACAAVNWKQPNCQSPSSVFFFLSFFPILLHLGTPFLSG
jgi:hypothetical protein